MENSVVGIDCADDCRNVASAIKSAGVNFVGRYYRWPKSKLKALTYNEAVALSGAGLSIVALWEWTSSAISNFSYHDGFDQGTSAYKQAMDTHQSAGAPIYFAADSDFAPYQIAGPINDYFQGVSDAFKAMGKGQSGSQIGVYGSGRTCAWLLDHQMAARSWLAFSPKWQGHSTFVNWDINQGGDDLGIAGLAPGEKGDYDSNVGKSTYGGFQVLT